MYHILKETINTYKLMCCQAVKFPMHPLGEAELLEIGH